MFQNFFIIFFVNDKNCKGGWGEKKSSLKKVQIFFYVWTIIMQIFWLHLPLWFDGGELPSILCLQIVSQEWKEPFKLTGIHILDTYFISPHPPLQFLSLTKKIIKKVLKHLFRLSPFFCSRVRAFMREI